MELCHQSVRNVNLFLREPLEPQADFIWPDSAFEAKDMDIVTAIVIITAIVAFNKSYRYRMKTGARESDRSVDYLIRHINVLEHRISNLETIVIEEETGKRFSELENV